MSKYVLIVLREIASEDIQIWHDVAKLFLNHSQKVMSVLTLICLPAKVDTDDSCLTESINYEGDTKKIVVIYF